jgi:hypothetical protein
MVTYGVHPGHPTLPQGIPPKRFGTGCRRAQIKGQTHKEEAALHYPRCSEGKLSVSGGQGNSIQIWKGRLPSKVSSSSYNCFEEYE